jgi:chromodomain-helicase-DNA-binding protein 1
VGARRNIPTKKQRQRQHAVAAGREPPSQAEVRFSARRTAQVANYNEEEDEDEFVEDDEDMTANYWANASEETGPVIDKVLDHKPKDGIGTLHICLLFWQMLTDHRPRRWERIER